MNKRNTLWRQQVHRPNLRTFSFNITFVALFLHHFDHEVWMEDIISKGITDHQPEAVRIGFCD
jgi:hypothetical protein